MQFRHPLTIVTMLLISCLSSVNAADVDAAAMKSLAQGNAALQKADGDPNENLLAALAFAKALPAYEAAGDQETASEIRATIFWCKKRMNLGTLEKFVTSKGSEGEVLVAAVAKVEQPVATGEAKDYIAKAETYAQKNPGQSLKIAIRFFEVADRFQGTPESLKAQRLSLEALQQSMANRRTADPALTADLHAVAIAAGDLPEAAQKLIDQSNQAVDALAAKASQDLAQDRRKAVDVVLREAEAAQKRGDLDPMIAHQTQAANLDADIPGLSKPATAAVEAYRKARAKNVSKTNADIAAERKRLTQALTQVRKEETKKGNTAGALATKQAVESIEKVGQEANPETGKKKPEQSENNIWREVSIDAMSDGVSIGKLQKGQVIVIQYVDGTWSFGGSMKARTLSPDASTAGAALRLSLFNTSSNTPTPIPGGTAEKPFEFTITESGNYSLRIVDSSRADNFGTVKYKYTGK